MKSQPLNRRKILYIITQGEWGGAQKYVYDLATNLADDFDITVAVGEFKSEPDLQKAISEHPNIKIISMKHLVRKVSPWYDILATLELIKLYKKIKPNIIHLNSSKVGVLGSIAKFLYSIFNHQYPIRVIYTVHGWVFNEPLPYLKKKIYYWLEKYTAKIKDVIIVLTNKDLADAQKLKISLNKIKLIPLGINWNKKILSKVEARELLKKYFPLDGEPILVGTIANFYKTKGLDILIQAIGESEIKNKNIKFIIIGDGPERPHLEKLIKKYQLKNVYLTGKIQKANELLPAFDLFVLPSRKEGLPYTVLEALRAKLPILATTVGGNEELLQHRPNTILTTPNSKEYLVNDLIIMFSRLEAGDFSPSLLTEEQFTIEKMINNTKQLYS